MEDLTNSVKRWRIGFILSCALLFGLRLWFIGTLPLSGDEAYHWEWSRHLAGGYYDHPPLTAYLIRLSSLVFGSGGEFVVRFPAVLCLTASAVFLFLLGRSVACDNGGGPLDRERCGVLSGAAVLTVPILAVFSVYMSTDPPLIFAWAMGLCCLYGAMRSGSALLWVAGGVSVGLALLSKFLGVFLGGALVLSLLLTRDGRRWLRRPQPYVAGVCALIVVSPFLWWNATHGWATFMFNFVSRQAERGLSLGHVAEYIGSQAIAVSPGIFVFCIIALGVSVRGLVKREGAGQAFLGLSGAMSILYFLYVSFWRRVGLHWPAAAWQGLLVIVAWRWTLRIAEGKRLGIWRVGSMVLCVAITLSIHVLCHLPPSTLDFELKYRGSPKRINIHENVERFGWHELGQWVGGVKEQMRRAQEEPRGIFVCCPQYGLAASLAFYSPDRESAHLWASRQVHGENYRYWDDYAAMAGMDAVFVAKKERSIGRAREKLEEHFSRVGEMEMLPIVVDGREVRAFYLVRCYGFDGRTPYPGVKRGRHPGM